MNEQDLTDALERRADDVTVGPPPVDLMTRTAARTRRRGAAFVAIASAAAVVVATAGVVQVVRDDGRGTAVTDVTDGPAVAAEGDVPPAGFRYVGLGRAAIAVPEEWPRNATECNATPKESTYVVDQNGVVCTMASAMPADTDAVVVGPSDLVDTHGWDEIEVDGVTALDSGIITLGQDPDGEPIAQGTVVLPDLGVAFAASSTVSEEQVAELLSRIVVLGESVGVPGFSDLGLDGGRVDDAYRQRLADLGLEAELVVQTDKMARTPGEVVSVEPEPGTVVEAGSVVRVTAAR